MKLTINIDVPTLERGGQFYADVFGFSETARPHESYAVLECDGVRMGLLAKPEGSSPAPGSLDKRSYARHWTPVHIDFHVADLDETLDKLIKAGGKAEQVHRMEGYSPIAFCCDPFGNGFCILEERKAKAT